MKKNLICLLLFLGILAGCFPTPSETFRKNSIIGNVVFNNSYVGVSTGGGNGTFIINNSIYLNGNATYATYDELMSYFGFDSGGLVIFSDGSYYENNIIENNSGYGIALFSSFNNNVSFNKISGNLIGVLTNTINDTFKSNVIENNLLGGMFIISSNMTLINNSIRQNGNNLAPPSNYSIGGTTYYLLFNETVGGIVVYDGSNINIINSQITNNLGSGVIQAYNGTVSVSHSNISDNNGTGILVYLNNLFVSNNNTLCNNTPVQVHTIASQVNEIIPNTYCYGDYFFYDDVILYFNNVIPTNAQVTISDNEKSLIISDDIMNSGVRIDNTTNSSMYILRKQESTYNSSKIYSPFTIFATYPEYFSYSILLDFASFHTLTIILKETGFIKPQYNETGVYNLFKEIGIGLNNFIYYIVFPLFLLLLLFILILIIIKITKSIAERYGRLK